MVSLESIASFSSKGMQDNRASMWVNKSIYWVGPPPHQVLISRSIAERLASVHSLDQYRFFLLQMLLVEMEAQSQKVDEQYHALAVELNIAGTHTRPLDERGAARMDGRLNEIRFVIRKKGDEQEAVTEEMNNVGNFISSISSHLLPSTPDTFVEVRSKREADAFLYNIGPIEKFKANRLREELYALRHSNLRLRSAAAHVT